MRTCSLVCLLMATAALFALATGCSQSASDTTEVAEVSGPPPAGGHNHADEDGDHENGTEHEGPHGGHVIELGRNHEYHAELVENEQTASVTVYISDKDFNEMPIDEPSIVMNLIVDGNPKTFALTAAGANGGKASRFDSADRGLFEALHEHEASGKLRVTINGNPYVGVVEHHDHHGEDDTDQDDDESGHGDGHAH